MSCDQKGADTGMIFRSKVSNGHSKASAVRSKVSNVRSKASNEDYDGFDAKLDLVWTEMAHQAQE